MPTPPSGKIVARPMVARSCGHLQEFQHYEVDKFRAQRLAKFQSTRCPDCVAKLLEEQTKAVPLSQAEALKAIPVGAQVTLTREADGSWSGTMLVEGFEVKTVGQAGAGPQAVVAALARLWLANTEEVAE
jgi:hypothetical protein